MSGSKQDTPKVAEWFRISYNSIYDLQSGDQASKIVSRSCIEDAISRQSWSTVELDFAHLSQSVNHLSGTNSTCQDSK